MVSLLLKCITIHLSVLVSLEFKVHVIAAAAAAVN